MVKVKVRTVSVGITASFSGTIDIVLDETRRILKDNEWFSQHSFSELSYELEDAPLDPEGILLNIFVKMSDEQAAEYYLLFE